MKCDILFKDCTVMMQDYSTPGHMAVAIDQSMVLEAVSYTHLDVYKRQDHDIPKERQGALRHHGRA